MRQVKGSVWLRGVLALAIGLVTLGLVLFGACRTKLAGEEITPAGVKRITSRYVKMRDGTRIAIDVWLPADYRNGEKLPVLIRSTRYWRRSQPLLGLRLEVLLRMKPADVLLRGQDEYFSRRRFVLVIADMRGSGASEGNIENLYSPAGIADLGELVTWAERQPWSNGHIGAYGMSYEADSAEFTAAAAGSRVRAVASLYGDFDLMLGFLRPGGVYDRAVIEPWSNWIYGLDRNDVCAAAGRTGLRCLLSKITNGGVAPVDSDPDGRELAAIVVRRHNPRLSDIFEKLEFRDDTYPTHTGPMTLDPITTYGLQQAIEASHASLLIWCGWQDAGTADGALSRYLNFSNTQIVRLGPYTHGANHGTDQFLRNFDPPDPPVEEQWRIEGDFFDGQLRQDPPAALHSHIDYYTFGEGKWHTTAIWPPQGMKSVRYYFGEGHRIETGAPNADMSADDYQVNLAATSGAENRWLTQDGGNHVDYGDRSQADNNLLTYTSDPIAQDTELTGTPVIHLFLSSTAADGAVFAYLEDVGPSGRVTYITEGDFRLINRKIALGPLPYEPLGPRHSYRRADAAPMVPGEVEEVEFKLFATSALLKRGHRIRIALAGADNPTFEQIPADQAPRWAIYHDRLQPSSLDLPMKTR
jgi:uncharacterized protein